MLGKLYHMMAVVSIAVVLAGAAVVGFMWMTDRLTPGRIETIASVLRGQLGEGDETEDVAAETEDQDPEAGVRSASAEELRQQRREQQVQRALSERARRDLAAQRELLEQALLALVNGEERLEHEKQAWTSALERRLGQARDQGFEKELSYVARLPVAQAKAHLVLKWRESPADAVRLLGALPESKGKRILAQMESKEEIQIMHELLERLSHDQVNQLQPGSGMIEGK